MYPEVLAFVRQQTLGVTVSQLASHFQTSLRKARRLLAYYRSRGFVTETRLRHNRGVWVVALSGGAPEPRTIPGGGRSLEEIRALLGGRSRFPFSPKDLHINRKSSDRNKALRGKRKSTFPPPGKHMELPTQPPAPIFPADGIRERVFSLERFWIAASRNFSGNHQRRSSFTSHRPWAGDRKQVWRWNAFVRLSEQILRLGADPKEYVAAQMEYFQRCVRLKRFTPNPSQSAGPHGETVWREWRERELAKDDGAGDYLAASADRAVRSREARVELWLREAYRDCRARGAEVAAAFAWPAEVIWVLCETEPAVRAVFRDLMAQDRDGDPVWRQMRASCAGDVRAVAGEPAGVRRRWREMRDRIAGSPGSVLPLPVEERPTGPTVDMDRVRAAYDESAREARAEARRMETLAIRRRAMNQRFPWQRGGEEEASR
jgi:hypothetical protein